MKKIKNYLILYIQALWDTTKNCRRLSCLQRTFFFFLCCFEKVYRLCFMFSQKIRDMRGGREISGVFVISVGNLTTGGTGKSVVVSFLVDLLGAQSCAIILRGYGRSIINGQKNVLVSDNGILLVDVVQAGDEAFMLAKKCQCSVVVGSDRMQSCKLLQKEFELLRYFILDDAYQNHQLKKNCEILLLDARSPFDNGRCLPAGRLREKDYHRANIILLTHADRISSFQCNYIKKVILGNFIQDNIMCVKHIIKSILRAGLQQIEITIFKNKRFLVFAGIGSFNNFIKSIEDFGLEIGDTFEFPDHHSYIKDDIERVIASYEQSGFDGAVTTEKDWYKLKPILEKYFPDKINYFFVATVSIEFLSQQEYSHFIEATMIR